MRTFPSLVLLVLSCLGTTALASSGGQQFTNCNGCHSGGTTPTVTLTASKTTLAPGEALTLTLHVSRPGTQTHAGFNIKPGGPANGTFTTGTSQRLVTSTGAPCTSGTCQLTHSARISNVVGVDNEIVATWTAPSTTGTYTFDAWGNAVNNGPNTSGDAAAQSAQVSVTVAQPLLANGAACTSGPQCTSGNCVDGVCCNTACNGGACDSCNVTGSAGTCTVLAAGTQCRAATTVCDVAETCDGTNAACPADTFASSSTVCRSSSAACDAPETCTGTSATCPADSLAAAGTPCRAANGACDVAESCTGTSSACPADTFASQGTQCRASAGDCDVAESCSGTSATCPADGFASAATVCRTSSGVCDLAETCTGSSASCPSDGFASSSTVCRAPSGACDTAETCTGTAPSCPSDDYASSGTSCRVAAGACDAEETCTGTSPNCPADGFLSSSTTCRDSAGMCDLPESCTGTGAQCPADTLSPLGALCSATYVCSGQGSACPTSCTSSQVCATGYFCSGGSCVPALANGQSCTANPDCSSGFCADGVCCNTACDGSCDACAASLGASADGTCTFVAQGSGGAPSCRPYLCTGSSAACGTSCSSDSDCASGLSCLSGECKGTAPNGATCAVNAECASQHCADGFCCNTACDGSCETCAAILGASADGTCSPRPAGHPGDPACFPGLCTVSSGAAGPAGACGTQCSADSDCAFGAFCQSGSCVAKAALGATCSLDQACASGHCEDGVCCNVACNGQCEACNVTGSVGTCSPVQGAPHGGRAACLGSGACAGTCNGNFGAGCIYPGAGQLCRDASCTSGVATLAAHCDGFGACQPEQTVTCAPYTCGATACAGSCISNADCGAGTWCAGGTCVAQVANGTACFNDAECGSGHCVDGVCCNSACTGQCEACDVVGNVGACHPVTGDPHGSRPDCTGAGTCAGTCDGTNAGTCSYPGAAVTCRPGSCAAGVAVLSAGCDGQGGCPPEQTQACGAFACGASACVGNCAADSDCAAGNWCSAGVCAAPQASGATCSAAPQCASGFCVDGTCCDRACDGQCEACAEAGKVGTCSAVTGAPRGGRTACSGLGACAAQCDGTSGVACAAAATESAESCNGVDDDCDGTVDDGAELCAVGTSCTAGECTPVSGTDGGTPDAGFGGNITGGCGCMALASGPAAWWALAALGLLAARRRSTASTRLHAASR